jgi:hypothetical protein
MPIPAFSIQPTPSNLSKWAEIYNNNDFLEDKICMPQPKHLKGLEKKNARLLHSGVEILKKSDQLPLRLSHIEIAIKDANYIVSLEDDWDSDGAIKIPSQIFNRAINFVIDYSISVFTNYNLVLVAPIISPVKDGSIDLLWETNENSLLVNIKNSFANDAFYYGVLDIRNQKNDFNGNIKTDNILSFFSIWLKEYQLES